VADTLKYRLPGKEIIEQFGIFEACEKESIQDGFVLADFNLKHYFGFKENKQVNRDKIKLHFQLAHPYVIEREKYLLEAEGFLTSFKERKLLKGVYSRVKKVEFDEQKSEALFFALAQNYPNSFVYLVSSTVFGTWVGATPEVLLSLENKQARTISLAGTKKTSDTSDWNSKEKEEQSIVTDYIHQVLNQTVKGEIKTEGPYEYVAGPVKHLRTDFLFDLENSASLDLVERLHPTPAVCGLPKDVANELILKMEKHNRFFYSGVVGLIGEQSTNLFVNLRCCQITEGSAFLYLGGGFTKDSIPSLEWEETENKSETLLNIFQKL